jgi:hypothetical protein
MARVRSRSSALLTRHLFFNSDGGVESRHAALGQMLWGAAADLRGLNGQADMANPLAGLAPGPSELKN